MDKKQHININGAEYSADYNFFVSNQLLVVSGRDGTVFFSRLNGMRFLQTSKRNLSQSMTDQICRKVHADICDLKYGGYPVD